MKPEATTIVYLALGSNLGDRHANLSAVVERLHERVAIMALSSLYETEPAYVTDQPRFLNAVLRGRTTLAASALLAFVKRIERELGRVTGQRYGPRVVDVDLLLYGEQTIDTPALTIPHPRMAERPFVLAPLAEIAPELIPPGWDQSVSARAAAVRGHGDVIAVVGRFDDDKETRRQGERMKVEDDATAPDS
jgi:2-amino-4-hydroxy-6-hydroxymethyldihydropteridine diphosphokinase